MAYEVGRPGVGMGWGWAQGQGWGEGQTPQGSMRLQPCASGSTAGVLSSLLPAQDLSHPLCSLFE